jgi:hypothetical protein
MNIPEIGNRKLEIKKIIILLSLICFCAPVALADIVIFRDGRQVQCRVKEIIDGQVGIQTETELYYVSKDKIKEVIYVKPVKDDGTMQWVITGSVVLTLLLGFALAMWGRNL